MNENLDLGLDPVAEDWSDTYKDAQLAAIFKWLFVTVIAAVCGVFWSLA